MRESVSPSDAGEPVAIQPSRGFALTGKTLRIDALEPAATSILRALGNDTRIAILRYLGNRIVPVNRIAEELHLPASTANLHIGQLERAGLIQTELQPARRGLQKICVRRYDEVVLTLPHDGPPASPTVVTMMPIGAYTRFEVQPSCGLASSARLIGLLDDPQTFAEPERLDAQLLWFRTGFVEYAFPNRVPAGARIEALQIAVEVCSEAPLSDPEWPSDISVWVNEVLLGAWTSPGDFGGQRGHLTPLWWEEKDTQFGHLKRWRVTNEGTTIDGVALSDVRLEDLGIRSGQPITVRLGVLPTAENVGGLNLFGRQFGNYPQDIELRLDYLPSPRQAVRSGSVE
jgi:predicted transcriptional regulator